MPRAFYPIDEEFEKSDTLNIIYEHYERVEDQKLLIEITSPTRQKKIEN